MRPTISLKAAAFFVLACPALLLAQTAHHATTHTLAHPATACAGSLDACPAAGCGGGDPSLNVKKNRVDKPTAAVQEFTFEDFTHLESERPGPGQYTPGDRKEIEDMGEDTYISLAGFLIGAHPGGTETCNCKISGEANNDYHLNLVEQKTGKMTDSVVVEMTPRVRPSNPSWTLTKLQGLLKPTNPPYVRVSGYLMLDTEHISRSGGPLLTIWEIHPVTKFEVCTTTPVKCDAGTGWKELQ